MEPLLFLVILEDRHFDNVITVHSSIEGAAARVEEIKAGYHRSFAEYQTAWEETTHPGKRRRIIHTSFDDGPKIRVEETELRA